MDPRLIAFFPSLTLIKSRGCSFLIGFLAGAAFTKDRYTFSEKKIIPILKRSRQDHTHTRLVHSVRLLNVPVPLSSSSQDDTNATNIIIKNHFQALLFFY